MRVIAGQYKGRRLRPVPGNTARSTADRVRESMFNILAAEIPGTRVLDLFCGAGTLGIEALSRGAAHAVFADVSRRSVQCTRGNLSEIHADDDAEVVTADAFAALRSLARKGRAFDLVFADPPYGENLSRRTLKAFAQSEVLAPEGILVIEHHKKESPGEVPPGFSVWTERRFGDTMFTIWRWQRERVELSQTDHPAAGDM
jgi:16S rRNA (guanine(966)-N(2))-methyltransferase RsmD